MFAALLSAVLFAVSTICGHRSATQIGGAEANFWRITFATICLGIWTGLFGTGIASAAFPLFLLSGMVGVGIADSGYFQALPRLGSRRTALIMQCFTAPFAALIEWLWLGTRLNLPEILCIAIILIGVAIALAPGDHAKIPRREWQLGVIFSLLAASGAALGAVLSRKAYALIQSTGEHVDPGSSNFQRLLGGLLIPAIILLVVKWRSAHSHGGILEEKTFQVSREKWSRIWPWVLANSLAGQTLGMSCFQWAVERTPTGIVTAIIAMTPIILLPMTRFMDGERITSRSVIGGLLGVGGVIGLTFYR